MDRLHGFRADDALQATALRWAVPDHREVARPAYWDRGDQILFGTVRGGLYRVPASGGEPEPLTYLDAERGETSHRWPFRIPGTAVVLFNAVTGLGNFDALLTGELAALDLDTTKVTPLGLAGVSPRYVPTGHLVYADEEGSLLAVRFDPASLTVTGTPVPVVRDIAVDSSGAAYFSISNEGQGRLVHASVRLRLPYHGWVWRDPRGERSHCAIPRAAHTATPASLCRRTAPRWQ